MPKIEVNDKLFFSLLGTTYDYDTLEKKLTFAKAELDEKPDMNEAEDKRVIKIELNDTNRPDLWSTAGLARCLREHEGAARKDYAPFLNGRNKQLDAAHRHIIVDEKLKDIRPYIVSFVITGKAVTEPMLLDIIQTQEKLCWNFGRKRKTIAMGVYREKDIRWPVHYDAVDPDKTSFTPLQGESESSCRKILEEHPKGKDYGWILKDFPLFPLLRDDKGEVLSMPPIINSASLGQVAVGDSDLLVELTGTDMESLLLSANIVACDFADAGYSILPVETQYPYDTAFGRNVAAPYYYQPTTDARLSSINKTLGLPFSEAEVLDALGRMGSSVTSRKDGEDCVFTVSPAPYRNDFLHEVDVIEDVMIGKGLDAFEPESPSDFTIGRLLPITLYSRKAKTVMTGLGYQEMIFNYLGSKKNYIDRMNIDGSSVIEIANPMSENYQFIRPSIIASLLGAEGQSANAVYPHKIYEIGKVAFIEPSENTGTKTIQSLGFLTAAGNATFNDAASEVSTLLYYLDHKYEVKESDDPRFISGRQAAIMVGGKQAGIFGEVHPQVLENWQIAVPCVAGEIDLEFLMEAGNKEEKAEAAPAKSEKPQPAPKEQRLAADQVAHFNSYIDLRVAKITRIERNPQGEKLYIEHLDDGSGTERIIQSGLVPYLREDELLGKHIILVANLAKRKMRGVESHGMLLAADYSEGGKDCVEVLTAPWAAPGTPVIPEGADPALEKPVKIDIDKLEKVELKLCGKAFQIAGVALTAAGKPITTEKASDGDIH